MKHSIKFFLALTAVLLLMPGMLRAQPQDPDDAISGQIVQAETDKPIAGAQIAVCHNGNTLLRETQSDAEGNFVAAPLLSPQNSRPGDAYVILVRADGYAMTTVTIERGKAAVGKIGLAPDKKRQFRITDTQGNPIQGASVQLVSLYAMPRQEVTRYQPPFPLNQLTQKYLPVKSDKQGLVVLEGLSSTNGKLEILAPGFASLQRNTWEARDDTIKVSRETVIEGRILYEDTGLPFYHPQPVAKVQAWENYQLWRQSPIQKDGSFEIHDIPALEVMGEKSLSICLELRVPEMDMVVTEPDMTISYMPLNTGYNAFLTREENGQKRWYQSYVEVHAAGVLYKEGERVRFDLFLHPMARIQGHVVLPPGAKSATVSYHDPLSFYGDWRVNTNAEGKFEIFTPIGDVTMNFQYEDKTSALLIKDLKGHETRTVELDFEKK